MSVGYAPDWVQSVSLDEINKQRSIGWPDFHPEDFCHQCGQRNPNWFTNKEDWQQATQFLPRRELEILCPSCFCHELALVEPETQVWELKRYDG